MTKNNNPKSERSNGQFGINSFSLFLLMTNADILPLMENDSHIKNSCKRVHPFRFHFIKSCFAFSEISRPSVFPTSCLVAKPITFPKS